MSETDRSLIKQLGIDSKAGLSSTEAKKWLGQYGSYALEEKKKNELAVFLGFFWGPIPCMNRGGDLDGATRFRDGQISRSLPLSWLLTLFPDSTRKPPTRSRHLKFVPFDPFSNAPRPKSKTRSWRRFGAAGSHACLRSPHAEPEGRSGSPRLDRSHTAEPVVWTLRECLEAYEASAERWPKRSPSALDFASDPCAKSADGSRYSNKSSRC